MDAKQYAKIVGQKHPTIWKLIRKIKNEIDADRAQLALDALGEPRRTKRGKNEPGKGSSRWGTAS